MEDVGQGEQCEACSKFLLNDFHTVQKDMQIYKIYLTFSLFTNKSPQVVILRNKDINNFVKNNI